MRELFDAVVRAISQFLYKQTTLILVVLFCMGIGIAISSMYRLSDNLIHSQALETAAWYSEAIREARTLYSSEVVDRLEGDGNLDVTIAHNYTKHAGAIPLPATFLMELSKNLTSADQGTVVRLYSDYPFPWRQQEGGPRNEYEREALEYLKQHPEESFYRFETFRGRESLRYAEADIMKPSCVECHNSHPQTPKDDWQVGDVRGIFEVTQPLDKYVAQTNVELRSLSAMLGGLSVLGLTGIVVVIRRLRYVSRELEKRVKERTAQLQESNDRLASEQQRSEQLLLNILPGAIADRLKQGNQKIAQGFAEVTILFADLVNFTQLAEQLPAERLVDILNDLFSEFDTLTDKHDLEKIKTIGDAYMVAGGLPTPREDHAEAVAEMALDILQVLEDFNARYNQSIRIRVGINTGPVVAGVIGKKKFIYDLWGDAVNLASRMESCGEVGHIQVSESTYRRLRNKYVFAERGLVTVKGKGQITAYWLTGRQLCSLPVAE